MPGDMLEVRILDVGLRQDWGYNRNRPLAGTLPDDFPTYHHMTIALDAERMVGRMPWGLEIPCRRSSGHGRRAAALLGPLHLGDPAGLRRQPRQQGAVAGATLHLPVFAPGALFSCGDGHGAQGDGEVNVTAIETALRGRFQFILHKGAGLAYPRAETPTHLITMGMDPDLDRCAEMALRDMIGLIVKRTGITREQAYALCSIAADLRVTQTVNQHKGVHCMIAKSLVGG